MKLVLQALTKFICGVLMLSALLFIPANTLKYPNAWLLMGLLFIPMFLLGVVLLIKAPELLKKRLQSKEKEEVQKRVIFASLMIFVGGFVAAGLDFRYQITHVPVWLVAIASILLLVSYGLYAEVMRENAYLSRTVEVQENQKVVDTGLYGIVRHPMYFSTVILFLSFPIVLGLWLSFVFFLGYPLLLVKRIQNEEEVLVKGLKGYAEYQQKVKYRMFPFIW